MNPKHIDHVRVPGALEVPVALQALAEKDRYDALIALGCIIRGETYHFELVANESGAGVSRVGLDYQLPVANAILTTENLEPRPWPARPTRAVMRPAWRWKWPTCWTRFHERHTRPIHPAGTVGQTPAAPVPHRHHRHGRAQGSVQVRTQPLSGVCTAGLVPAPGRRQRGHRH